MSPRLIMAIQDGGHVTRRSVVFLFLHFYFLKKRFSYNPSHYNMFFFVLNSFLSLFSVMVPWNIFVCGLNHSGVSVLSLEELKKMSSTSRSRLCSCFRSMWASTVQFIVSQDESVKRRRRLLLGIVVLLLVDVLWVGSSELTDVRTNLLLIINNLLLDSVRKLPPNI